VWSEEVALQTITRWIRFSILPLFMSAAHVVLAAPPSDSILPRTTKGYVSVARPAEFRERWRQTQFGQMLDDEIMQPFVESLRKQLQDKYHSVEDKLGLVWEDLENMPRGLGELSLALIERPGKDAALAISIDFTGNEVQAEELLGQVEKRFAARGGRRETTDRNGAAWHVFTVPAQAGNSPLVTVYFFRDATLVGVDDLAEAEAMLQRFSGKATDHLAGVAAYGAVMERCRRASGDLQPELRWFIEPFGFIFAVRTLLQDRRREGPDYVKIFSEQGFDAIQGAGGFVNVLLGEGLELVQRTAIYAPPVRGKENDPLRWNLSMRMLQTPNVQAFEPQSWVPRDCASYTTAQWRLTDAFDNLGPLFDALQQHENAWANTLEGWKNDPYGPQVDVRQEFLANLGERITILAGYNLPITAESERVILAIEATNEQALSEALAKWMSREPDFARRQLGQFIVWERVAQAAVEEPQVDVPLGFTPLTPATEEDQNQSEREPVLPNSVVTVALGHLMMASHIDYLSRVLGEFGQRERLAASADYRQVLEVLNRLSPNDRCALHFGRSDEEFRPTYELIRQGKMPEAKTMFGKLLNNILTTEKQREDGILREQQIEGSSLPSFEAVRRYFGPHGRVTRSERDGWFITGAILNKEAP